tara:strand:- start:732 stop:2474 length:1743 start_codon:yes stop_codon:yes gene_type:complete
MNKPKAYSYLRFSTSTQIDGNSQERQLDSSREWCSAHNLELAEEMQDHGISAFRGKHRMIGVLGKFLELVRLNKIEKHSILIVENIDRLSREKVLDALGLYIEIIKAEITIVTLIDRQTHSRETIEQSPYILQMAIASMVRANDESEIKSKRGVSNWEIARKKALNGELSNQFKLPSWLKKDGAGKPVFQKNKVLAIKRIFELFSQGETLLSIARKLNTEGHKPLTNLGKSGIWQISTIRKVLRAKSVSGTLVFKEPYFENDQRKYRIAGEVENYLPKVITSEMFAKVQTMLSASSTRSQNRKGGSRASPKNAFSGIAKSIDLGGVAYQASGKNEYLKTNNLVTSLGEKRKSRIWNYMDFQDIFIATCRLALKASSQISEEEQELSLVGSKLEDTTKSMETLLEMAKNAKDSKADLLIELDKMAFEKKELKKKSEELKNKILSAKESNFEIPKNITDRVELNRILKANVKIILIDFANKMFSCELFSGVKYEAWLDKDQRLFVKTNDFKIPQGAFDNIRIRSTIKHFIEKDEFIKMCHEFNGDQKSLANFFGILKRSVQHRISKIPELHSKYMKRKNNKV